MTLLFGGGEEQPRRVAGDMAGFLLPSRRHHFREGRGMAEAARCRVAARPGSRVANRADVDRFRAPVGPAPVFGGIPVTLGWVDEPVSIILA